MTMRRKCNDTQNQKKASYTVVELIGKGLDIVEHIIKQKTKGGKPES